MEKAKAEAKKAKAKAEREKDEAEQHGYDVGVVETEDALRAEVPAVCRAFCAQTWEEALNWVGVDASFELGRPENVFFLLAIRASGIAPGQKEVALQSPSPPRMLNIRILPLPVSRSWPKNPQIPPGTSLDKVAEALQPGAASQSFEKDLALTTLPVGGASKEKDMEIPLEATDKAPKSKLQIKLKP